MGDWNEMLSHNMFSTIDIFAIRKDGLLCSQPMDRKLREDRESRITRLYKIPAESYNLTTTQIGAEDYGLRDYIIISAAFLSARARRAIRSRKSSPRSSVRESTR